LEGVKKRGDDYDEVKRAIGSQMVEQACSLFPQIRDKILYTEIGGSTLPIWKVGNVYTEIGGSTLPIWKGLY
jgi:hypothetical protein